MRHLQSKETVLTFSQFVYLALILVYFGKNSWTNNINKFMLKSLKRTVDPGPFSRSLFKVSDQIKEYLIKQNGAVIFSHHQLKKVLELGIVFEQHIKMAKLHIMVVNSMLLPPQWRGLDSRNWQFLKFLNRANVAEFKGCLCSGRI